MIEVTCPRHGRVDAEVEEQTGAGGPPCPTCGSACTIYAPMLALARACADAAPRLGIEGLLQALRHDGGPYAATPRSSPAPPPRDDTVLSEPPSAPPALATPPSRV